MELGLKATLTMKRSLETHRVWEKPIVNDPSMFKYGVTKAWHSQDCHQSLDRKALFCIMPLFTKALA